MSRKFVIGDIHGCYEELLEMLELLQLTPEDTLYSLGDLIHKGPSSHKVLAIFRSLPCKTVLIAGNHEERQLRYIESPFEGVRDELKEPYSIEEINQMKEMVFSVRVEGFLLVHGGISEDAVITDLALGDLHKYSSKEKKKLTRVLYSRFLAADGHTRSIADLDDDCFFWAERYTGEEGKVIFGHHPFEEITYFPYAIGIDTGCVNGGKLSCAEIRAGEIVNIYSINAKKAYYTYEE